MPLTPRDAALVRLAINACEHRWQALPRLGRVCLDAGCTQPELRGCVRHLAVLAGYPTCLAATVQLQAAGLLEGERAAAAHSAPGDAFERVYGKVAGRVRARVEAADPVLAQWIQASRPAPASAAAATLRVHAYGAIYSAPGLTLLQKQFLTIAFLAGARMHDELYGHLLAALRLGAAEDGCRAAVCIAFEPAQPERGTEEAPDQLDEALQVVARASAKAAQSFKEETAVS